MFALHVPVAPVRRRLSRLDPPAGSWALIGETDLGLSVADSFAARGIRVVRYDTLTTGRSVIAIDEIDDVDSLAVTSQDVASGEIHTDYFAGVVCCISHPDRIAEDFVASDAAMFSPFHPAFLVPGATADAEVAADYAQQLAADPRTALARHRHFCGLE